MTELIVGIYKDFLQEFVGGNLPQLVALRLILRCHRSALPCHVQGTKPKP